MKFDAEIEIYNLAVTENRQRHGVGMRLMKRLTDAGRQNHVKLIWLEVRKSNTTGLSFYKNNNFCEIYRRKNFYSNPPEDAIVMKREIGNPRFFEKITRIYYDKN